jgi:UDP-glucose 4-epimerase
MILVTGGSGLIGQTLIRDLIAQGERVINISASTDVEGAINIHHDLNQPCYHSLLELSEPIEGIIHLAAAHNVMDSLQRPWHYYEQNGAITSNVVGLAVRKKVNWVLFASTCMIYRSQNTPIQPAEDQLDLFQSSTISSNPYAQSKFINELELLNACNMHDIQLGVFRVFNIAGPMPAKDSHRSRFLIPSVLQAIKNQETFVINQPMRMGKPGFNSILRDYIHVDDVAEGFVKGIEYLRSDVLNNWILNLGTGVGTSVTDVIASCEQITGAKLKTEVGDPKNVPDCIVADMSSTQAAFNWLPKYSVKDIIEQQWRIYNEN